MHTFWTILKLDNDIVMIIYHFLYLTTLHPSHSRFNVTIRSHTTRLLNILYPYSLSTRVVHKISHPLIYTTNFNLKIITSFFSHSSSLFSSLSSFNLTHFRNNMISSHFRIFTFSIHTPHSLHISINIHLIQTFLL